jgi:hypothetical protein
MPALLNKGRKTKSPGRPPLKIPHRACSCTSLVSAKLVSTKSAGTSFPQIIWVKLGLVASLARPGGNATGLNFF